MEKLEDTTAQEKSNRNKHKDAEEEQQQQQYVGSEDDISRSARA